MTRKYDIIIYGASGYTGTYVVEEAVNTLKSGSKAKKFTWAVAGRSDQKLTETLTDVTKFTGVDVTGTSKIVADTSSLKALRAMAAQCSVLVNVVGPYSLYGENVVKACLAERTSQVDISGELQFLEKMQVLYHEEAESKGIYIVGACGYDSVPGDCGVAYLQQKFKGEINSIECYGTVDLKDRRQISCMVNIGSWNSVIHIFANLRELKALRQALFPKHWPKLKYPALKRWPLHYSKEMNGWSILFPGIDPDVVKRSQYQFFTQERRRPVQYNAYMKYPHLLVCFLALLIGVIAILFSQFQYGLHLLQKYPRLFSFGIVKPGGPTREQAENNVFSFHFTASGWAEKLAAPADQHSQPPNKQMKLVISGVNPGYRATGAMLLQSALSILHESDKLPSKGGVFPPGYAFAKTSLIPRLESRGIEFKLSE